MLDFCCNGLTITQSKSTKTPAAWSTNHHKSLNVTQWEFSGRRCGGTENGSSSSSSSVGDGSRTGQLSSLWPLSQFGAPSQHLFHVLLICRNPTRVVLVCKCSKVCFKMYISRLQNWVTLQVTNSLPSPLLKRRHCNIPDISSFQRATESSRTTSSKVYLTVGDGENNELKTGWRVSALLFGRLTIRHTSNGKEHQHANQEIRQGDPPAKEQHISQVSTCKQAAWWRKHQISIKRLIYPQQLQLPKKKKKFRIFVV